MCIADTSSIWFVLYRSFFDIANFKTVFKTK